MWKLKEFVISWLTRSSAGINMEKLELFCIISGNVKWCFPNTWKTVWQFLYKVKHTPTMLFAVQSLSHVQLFATPWTAAFQASLSLTVSQSLLNFTSIELVMLSNHLILWCSPKEATSLCQQRSISQSYGFSSSHVQMWKLDHKEGWASKHWCFWNVALEKTHESSLDSKKINPCNPKGNQPWIFTGSTNVEAETPTLWPPDAKSQLIGKDLDAGKDWGQEKGMTEDEMVRLLTQWTWVWANSGR